MLTELGILPPKEEDYSKHIAKKLRDLSHLDLYEDVLDLMDWLNRSGRRPATVYNYLCRIEKYGLWIKTVYPELDSRTVHESKIVEYLENLLVEGCQPSQQRDSLLTLKRFFARLCYRKKIFANPCQNLCPSKMQAKINIVAPTDLKKLIAYIQDDSSPSEEALTLVLIIFFGFKTEDLLRATIDVTANDHFRIILHQSPRSCGKQHYNREQFFELPSTPRWLQVLKGLLG